MRRTGGGLHAHADAHQQAVHKLLLPGVAKGGAENGPETEMSRYKYDT